MISDGVDMSKKFLIILALLISAGIVSALECEWDFSKGNTSLCGKYKLTAIGGTKFTDEGLEMPLTPRSSAEGARMAERYPELTEGAFKMNFAFTLRAEHNPESYALLWDSKHDYYDKGNGVLEDNSGLTIGLCNKTDAEGTYRPQVWMGFGKKTSVLAGKFQELSPNERHEMTVDYDGIGQMTILLDGKVNSVLKVMPGGPVAPPCFAPVIGDRGTGNFLHFNGVIHSLKISTHDIPELLFETPGRLAFRRDEAEAFVQVNVKALKDVRNVVVESPVKLTLGNIANGESKSFSLPVSNALIPGKYAEIVKVVGDTKEGNKEFLHEVPYRVAPIAEEAPFRLLMWWYEDDYRILQKTGFNYGLRPLISPLVSRKGESEAIIRQTLELMDDMLCNRFYWWDYANSGHWGDCAKQFPALKSNGEPYINRRGNNVLDPTSQGAHDLLLGYSRTVLEAYKGHPTLAMIDLQSEIHDKAVPLFGDKQREDFKKYSGGMELPTNFTEKTCLAVNIPDFPAMKILKDDYAPLVYFKWLWKEGDGWREMNDEIAKLYHSYGDGNFRTYFAPAARTAPIWDGNHADIKGQWTYSNPDPIRMAAGIDELAAITADVPNQPIISGIQLICYRNQLAPEKEFKGEAPEWLDKHPDAAYITLPPDMLKESVWCCISRKLEGIVFHGDGSLYAPPIKGASVYIFTNAETEPALSELLHNVVIPLGQVLKSVPERKRDIAVLNSFPSAIFAGRGSYGWGGWTMDVHLALQYAGYDPRMIVDEEILRDDLEGVKVLVLPHCDVMTESVVAKVKAFQLRGGIVIADGTEVPAILPDFHVTPFERCYRGDVDKQKVQELAVQLKEKLQGLYTSYSSTSNEDLIAHVRTWKDADYLFAINDRRVFGDYVGQWGRVMEKGIPNKGTVIVRRGDVGAVYDVAARKAVPFSCDNGRCEIPVEFSTTDGRLLMLLPSPVGKVEAKIKGKAIAGEEVAIEVTVRNVEGKAVSAMVPVKVELYYANGVECDASGYFNAADGVYRNKVTIPNNAPEGAMTLKVTELVSGLSDSQKSL